MPVIPDQGHNLYFDRVIRALTGQCRRFYFRARESLGWPKREIIVYRVKEARDSLEEAKRQFSTALDKFSQITHFDGGSLEGMYLQLKFELDHSHIHAKAVHDRIVAVEDVAIALFVEWEDELNQYASRSLKNSSRQQLKLTEQHYSKLMKAMHRAETKIVPVLVAFKDQVLFLKHNLNAQAITSLHHELRSIGVDIAKLIEAMERSIMEANAFVNSLGEDNLLPYKH